MSHAAPQIKSTHAIHPGEILLKDFLEPLGLTRYRLAKDIHVTLPRINDIVHGRRSISADTALRLGTYFGLPAQFWMNLQADYDLRLARANKDLKKIKPRSGGSLSKRYDADFQPFDNHRNQDTPLCDRIVRLIRKRRVECGVEPRRIGSALKRKVVLQRKGGICIVPWNCGIVTIVAALHFHRQPALCLIHMTVVKMDGTGRS